MDDTYKHSHNSSSDYKTDSYFSDKIQQTFLTKYI